MKPRYAGIQYTLCLKPRCAHCVKVAWATIFISCRASFASPTFSKKWKKKMETNIAIVRQKRKCRICTYNQSKDVFHTLICRLQHWCIVTARCYASIVYAVITCQSVHLSVCHCHKPVLCQNGEHRIMQTMPYDSPGTFLMRWSPRSSKRVTIN